MVDIKQTIQAHSNQPLTHQLLLSLLKDYKRPNEKIHTLLNQGVLQSIKKGLYVIGPEVKAKKPETFLLANHIFGPSYVSLDAALAYHGLIPERIYEVSSITVKASRNFKTPLGLFSYIRLPLPYYAFGLQQVKLAEEQFALVASPEKALTDKVITTSGIILRSIKEARDYLLENLRIDETDLKNLNTKTMLTWLQDAPKKDSLSMIVKTINGL